MSLQDNELACFAIYRSGVRTESVVRAGEDEAQDAPRTDEAGCRLEPRWREPEAESPAVYTKRRIRDADVRDSAHVNTIPLGNRPGASRHEVGEWRANPRRLIYV